MKNRKVGCSVSMCSVKNADKLTDKAIDGIINEFELFVEQYLTDLYKRRRVCVDAMEITVGNAIRSSYAFKV